MGDKDQKAAEGEASEAFPLALLPDDLLIVVLEQLSAKHLCLVSRVCTSWRDIGRMPSSLYDPLRLAVDFLPSYPRYSEPSTWKQLYIAHWNTLAPSNEKIRSGSVPRASALAARATVHVQLKHYEAAIRDLTAALALPPVPVPPSAAPGGPADRRRLLFSRAIAYAKQGTQSQAKFFADLDAIIQTDPSSLELVYECGSIAADEGFFDKAESCFDKCLAASPTSRKYNCALADVCCAKKSFNKAITSLTVAMQATSSDIQLALLGRRARVYSEMEDHASAMADVTEAISRSPRHEFIFLRGRFYTEMSKYSDAYDDFSVAIGLLPCALYYNWRGIVQLHLNRLSGALEDTKKAVEMDPKSQQDLGIVYFVLNRMDLALPCFDATIRSYPQVSYHYLWRSRVHTRAKDWASAIRDIDTAIRLKPEEMPFYWRGLTHLDMGNFEQGWIDLEKSYKSAHPASARTCFWFGIAYLLQEKPKEAETKFQEASNSAKGQSGVILAISKLTEPARISYFQTKSTKFAKDQYRKALAGSFGLDMLVTEEYYLTLLKRLFPDDLKLARLARWFQARRREVTVFDGRLD